MNSMPEVREEFLELLSPRIWTKQALRAYKMFIVFHIMAFSLNFVFGSCDFIQINM